MTTRAEQPERGTALPSGNSLLRAVGTTRSRSGRHRQPEQHPAPYRDVFAIREFRGLWFAQALSHAGDQVAQVAIAVLVYAKTGSAFLTAVAYALTYLPLIAGGPLLSGLADLFPRHRVMITLDLIRAGLVAIMALPRMPFAGLCALLFGTVLLSPPFSAARSALLPDVLPPDKFVIGTAIGNITFQISQIAGFVLGAGAVAMLGPNRALAMDVLSFCLSAMVIACWVTPRPAPPRETEARPSLLAVARDGTALVFGSPLLRTLVFFGWLAGFAVVPEGLAAPYAHALGGGPLAVGLLMAAMPAGTIVGTFAIGHLTRPSDRMRPMGWLAMLSCAPLVVSLLHPAFWLVLALWGLAGAGGTYQLAAAAAFVRALPASDRARAFGIAQSGLLAAQGLGILAGGALAQWLGPQAAVALSGLLGLILAAVLATGWTQQHGEMIMTLSGAPRTPEAHTPEAGTPEAYVPEAPAAAPQPTEPQAHLSPLPRLPVATVPTPPAPEMPLPPAERWRPQRIRRGPHPGVSRRSWPSRAAVRRDGSLGGGGANGGAIGDDDNAARRPPATVQPTTGQPTTGQPNTAQQARDLRDAPEPESAEDEVLQRPRNLGTRLGSS